MPGFCGRFDVNSREGVRAGRAAEALGCTAAALSCFKSSGLEVLWDPAGSACGERGDLWMLFYGKLASPEPPVDVVAREIGIGGNWASRLRGQYTLAVFDKKRRVLTLVREKLGLHQLYYSRRGGGLAFGTTLPSTLSSPGPGPELCRTAALDFMMFGFVPSHETLFRDVLRLPPAHRLDWDGRGEPRLEQYWEIEFAEEEPRESAAELGKIYLERLRQGIAWHASGRRTAVAYSGGIDSAFVAREAVRAGLKVHTYTLCYAGSRGQVGARAWAAELAGRIGAEHREITLDAEDYLRLHRRFVLGLGEGVNADSCGLLSLCEQAARDGCEVVLSGNGVESSIGRQNLMVYALWAERGARLPPVARAVVESLLYPLAKGRLWQPFKQTRLAWLLRRDPGFLSWYMLNPGQSFSDMSYYYRGAPDGGGLRILEESPALKLMSRCLSVQRPWTRFHKAIYCSQKSWLINAVGYYIHRTGELASVPVGQPFLYPGLTDFLYRLSETWKLEWPRCKKILYQAASEVFPPDIVSRPKDRVAGFGLLDWAISRLGHKVPELRRFTREELSGYDFLRPLLDVPASAEEWRREPCGRLYTLALWHRRYIRGERDEERKG